jgi:hypothetical protein
MKKVLTYAFVLLIVTIITVSGTYAVFTINENIGGEVELGAHEIKVIYSGDIQINGVIDLVRDKSGGFRRTVNIALAEGSVATAANIYIFLSEVQGLNCQALKWEIYSLDNDEETYLDSGTFLNYTSGEKIYMETDIELSLETKQYVVYIWLNGYEAGNEVKNGFLKGYIGAESTPVTGNITEE